jgi:hypothetical protein
MSRRPAGRAPEDPARPRGAGDRTDGTGTRTRGGPDGGAVRCLAGSPRGPWWWATAVASSTTGRPARTWPGSPCGTGSRSTPSRPPKCPATAPAGIATGRDRPTDRGDQRGRARGSLEGARRPLGGEPPLEPSEPGDGAPGHRGSIGRCLADRYAGRAAGLTYPADPARGPVRLRSERPLQPLDRPLQVTHPTVQVVRPPAGPAMALRTPRPVAPRVLTESAVGPTVCSDIRSYLRVPPGGPRRPGTDRPPDLGACREHGVEIRLRSDSPGKHGR